MPAHIAIINRHLVKKIYTFCNSREQGIGNREQVRYFQEKGTENDESSELLQL